MEQHSGFGSYSRLPGKRSEAFTLANLNLSRPIDKSRMRDGRTPLTAMRRVFGLTDPVVWIIQDDAVGYMLGAVVSSNPPGEPVRVFLQDGVEREFRPNRIVFDPRKLDSLSSRGGVQILLNVKEPGIAYRPGDRVYTNVYSTRRLGTVRAYDDDSRIVTVRMDDSGEVADNPASHVVLHGPGFSVPQVESAYNVRRVFD